MSKICPNCQTEYDDSHDFCYCGSRLIDDLVANDPILNVGDATAIMGGVNVNQSRNVTSHDTHYHSTTVHERSKSELEIKLDAANQLREKAEGIMAERGRIDSVAMSQLRPLASQLGIDDETFKSIIKDVRSNRNGGAMGLGAADARYLQQALQAVQTNNMDALSPLTHRLEAMASISMDDNVQYLYYLTLSLFYPIKSIEVYERQIDENYWRLFWAIISYIRCGKYEEAEKRLPKFFPLRFEKAEDDRNLLEAYFNIMKSNKDAAQEFLDDILDEPTAQIKPLLRAIESTLYEEEPESLEVRFYMERVMTKSDVVVKSAKSAEPKPAAEATPKEATPEAKEKTQTAATTKEASAPKDNKEADDLYAKAAAASGAKRVMLLQKAADAGSLDAMYDLANCYYDGEGVGKNIPLAVKWLQKAADLGHVTSLAALGDLYINGAEGVDQNYALSEKYFLIAADYDNLYSQAGLAVLYLLTEEYEKSLLWARKAAQQEEPLALFTLGRIYDEGLGVEVDHIEGLKWLEKAADKGYEEAQNMVGNIYLNADYVEHDPQKAFKYYQMAAAQGHLEGMANLGWCYQEGIGTDVNFLSAEEWIRKAADGGLQDAIDILNNNPLYSSENNETDLASDPEPIVDESAEYQKAELAYDQKDYDTAVSICTSLAENNNADALNLLGDCYLYGNGVKQDYKQAVEWYQKSADLGNEVAMYNLGYCYENGNGVKQDYKKAVEWYQKAADLGDTDAMCSLGYCYENGNGVKQDYKKAVEWYQKAADLGDTDAMCSLGHCYFNGNGVRQDYKQAVEWYQKSADLGDARAMRSLGACYDHGNGVPQDYIKAFDLYMKSSELGNAYAMFCVGVFYAKGNGVQQDNKKAFEWYKKSAELGIADAMNNLGACYYGGHGTEQNYKKAFEWYEKSAELGYILAMRNLGVCYENGNGTQQNHLKAVEWYQKAAELGDVAAQEWLNSREQTPVSNKPSVKIKNKNSPNSFYSAWNITLWYDVVFEFCENRTVKFVSTIEPKSLEGASLSVERIVTLDKNGDQIFDDGTRYAINKSYCLTMSYGIKELCICDSGKYPYKANLDVYDENGTLLSTLEHDFIIKYKHKIFGSNEAKVIN